ncbi:MAG: glycosyltransferase, partial [Verrucomicrobiales bacterium]|nr:glycosyltransferase [Verrucomicrobiales bacterium]
GGFQKAFATHHPKMRWLEPFVRWYSGRWGILYGDHSVFVRREVFEAMGGFAAVKLMEDVDFSDRIRQEGKVVLLDPPLETSMRRFKRRGYLKNRLQNLLFVWLWRMRLADDKTLYRWYYRSG